MLVGVAFGSVWERKCRHRDGTGGHRQGMCGKKSGEVVFLAMTSYGTG